MNVFPTPIYPQIDILLKMNFLSCCGKPAATLPSQQPSVATASLLSENIPDNLKRPQIGCAGIMDGIIGKQS